jgi:hypothetical protein
MKITSGKVTLTEWDGDKMFAVSFEVPDRLDLGVFKTLLDEAERKLYANMFEIGKYKKLLKKGKA